MTWKESGRIRGRFGRNIGIYNKGWKIIDDSCAFLNAIRLIVILITGKSVKFCQSVYCFFKIWFWIVQYDPFHTIINKFYLVFKELSPGLVSSNFEMCYGCIFQKWITASIEKMERWPRDTQKVIFLFMCATFLCGRTPCNAMKRSIEIYRYLL